MTRVGFLGPGRMGRPMVGRLLAAGHEVVALARRPEVRADLAAAGARPVTSAAAAVAEAEVVVVCLFSDEQLVEVCDGLDGLVAGVGPGVVVASHVTGRRTTVLGLGERLAERGASLVDAPVSGGVDEIDAGRLTVMLGGSDSACAAATPVLGTYASPIIRTGELGSALAVKLVNNLLFAVHSQAASAAVELADRLGVERAALFEVLAHASGNSYAASRLGAGDLDTWAEVIAPFLRKDVAACAAELADAGVADGFLLDTAARGPLPIT
ncbi:MAG TPA: NAD(P)-dependent oxidoreductase [Nocardioides sp.]|nr:NAD(P)-dependent oxidoreductase [Nocardioides sp.]